MSFVFTEAWGKTMQKLRTLKVNLAVAICLAGLTLPAAALGVIPGSPGGGSAPTPAPIAGAGLIAIGVAGAAIYAAVLPFLPSPPPAPPLSWLGRSGLSAYIAVTSPPGSASRRSAWILLALTVPIFWSRILFLLMSDTIL